MGKIKPITPAQVAAQQLSDIPDEVIEIWNRVLAKRYRSGSATIKQDEIVQELVSLTQGDRQKIFENGWLEIEELYNANGWNVEYDKPGYNESYDAFFVFRKKSRG